MVYAYYCGNFIFHFRKYDTTQKNFLLRGDKLIHKYYINSNEDEALIQLINDYGIKYVIVESFNSKYLSYIKQTKKILNTNKFIKLKEIKLTTDIRAYTNSSILIYEYKGQPQINKKFITYDLNLAGQTITYPINLLINHETTDNF